MPATVLSILCRPIHLILTIIPYFIGEETEGLIGKIIFSTCLVYIITMITPWSWSMKAGLSDKHIHLIFKF